MSADVWLGVLYGATGAALYMWGHFVGRREVRKYAGKPKPSEVSEVMEYGIMGDVSHWPALKPAYPGDLLPEIASHDCPIHKPFNGPLWASRQDVVIWMRDGGYVREGR